MFIVFYLIAQRSVGRLWRCGVSSVAKTTSSYLQWAHVDINSYFATMMQQENPHLRGKPIGILKSAGRTCIIAASNEAKTYGVKTGCRVSEAKQLCPHIILVPATFDLYLSATRVLRDVLLSLTPNPEIFSLDEAFLPLGSCSFLYTHPQAFGSLVQQRIQHALGVWVTCNVGIASSRFLAKMAGEVAPKNSVHIISKNDEISLLAATSFKDVCGIGFHLEKRLHAAGITSLAHIPFFSHKELVEILGPFWAVEVEQMSMGMDPSFLKRITPNKPMQCVSRTITGYRLCNDEDVIRRTLLNLTTEVITKIRTMKLAGRRIGVFLEGRTERWSKHLTTQMPICHTKEMFEFIYDKMYTSSQRNFPVIRFGVSLSLLEKQQTQLHLLHEWNKQEKIEQAIEDVTQKHGLFSLRPATLLHQGTLIRPEVTGFLGDKQFLGLT